MGKLYVDFDLLIPNEIENDSHVQDNVCRNN